MQSVTFEAMRKYAKPSNFSVECTADQFMKEKRDFKNARILLTKNYSTSLFTLESYLYNDVFSI